MRAALIISLIGLAAVAMPAAAQHEQHQHGQEAAQPAAVEDKGQAGGGTMGGCMKGGGMMGGGMGHGMMHGARKHCDRDDASMGELKERIRQLEKRLDMMQVALELLADRQGGACPHHGEDKGQHHGMHH